MNFYFTFGMNTNFRNAYLKIEADSKDIARNLMFSAYGNRWAFCYTEQEFEGQAEKYGLREVEFGTPLNSRNERVSECQ